MIVMKYYTSTTEFNCGIDLHAHQMYVCLMDRNGNKLVHSNLRHNDFDFFLKLVAPYKHDLTVCAECLGGNKFKANTVLAIKLARAVYYMLKNKTVFDPERLAAALAKN